MSEQAEQNTAASIAATPASPPPASPDAKVIEAAVARARAEWEAGSAKRDAETRAKVMAELGIETPEQAEEHRRRAAEADAKRPEWERKARETEKRARELEAAKTEADKQIAEWAERWFSEYRQRVASTVARAANLHDQAEDDLDAYLDRCCETEGDKLLFRDARHGVEIDMAASDATKKLAEHVAKVKPQWVRPTVPGAGIGIATPDRASVGANGAASRNPRAARDAFIQDTVRELVPLMRQRR